MSAHSPATSPSAAVTADTIRRVGKGSQVALRAAASSYRERALRVIGQSATALSASAWLVVDLSILIGGIYWGYSLFPPPVIIVTPHIALWQAGAIFAFVVTMASLVFGLYERETLMSRSRILTRMTLTVVAATVAAYAIIYVLMYATVSRRVAALAMAVYLVGGTTIRLGAWWAIHRVHRGLLVVGPRSLYESFNQAKANGLLCEYRLVGFARAEELSPEDLSNPECFGTVRGQLNKLRRMCVTDIVVGADAANDTRMMDWMVPCLQRGCRVTNEAIFYEKATGQILVDEITPLWFLFADLKSHCNAHATLKRVFDVTTTLVAFYVSVPLWPLIALAIKLGDGGRVFYSQNRVGQNGKTFKLYKFRTMRPNAENGKSVWCVPDDPRITRVGRVLRKCRLDELPQLYNVLIGQMSVVGPRPERPDIVNDLAEKLPYYTERHLAKPGITGWAQISFRYGSTIEDAKRKLQFDLYYLKHMSFELDIIILLRTIGTFLKGAC